MKLAVFLDRDGVINNLGDGHAPFKYDEFKIRNGVRGALEDLGKMGFLRILATNQPDVAYGNMSQADYDKIMADVKKLPLDDIFVCTHGRDDGCECKKPKPGMLLAAAKKWGIDLQKSFMIGDSENDIKAGQAAGCKTILIDYKYNKDLRSDARVTNLSEIVKLVNEDFH